MKPAKFLIPAGDCRITGKFCRFLCDFDGKKCRRMFWRSNCCSKESGSSGHIAGRAAVETLDDLNNAESVITRLLSIDWYAIDKMTARW